MYTDRFDRARYSHFTASQIISHYEIDSDVANDLALVLIKVETLRLIKVYLENPVVLYFVRALLHNVLSLTEIQISNSNIGSEAAKDIAVALSHNTNLQKLKMQENIIQTPNVIKITRALQDVTSLTEFRISNNNIGCEAADSIAAVLSSNSQLREFCARGNNLETLGAINLAKALKNISSLTTCDLSNNHIGDEAADDIATIMHHNIGIKRFIVNNNDLKATSAIKLIRALHSNKFLTYFSTDFDGEGMGNVKVSLSGSSLFIDGDKFSRAMGSHVASSELISKCNTDCEVANDMAIVLAKVKSARLMNICLENAIMLNFVKLFMHNISSLEEFNVASNNVGSEAADDIAAVLSHNAKLQSFRMHKNVMETQLRLQNPCKILHL